MRDHRDQARRGNVFVEFALGFGLIAILASGGVVFGLALDQYNELQTAVRRAARYGAAASLEDVAAAAEWRQRVRNVAVYGVPEPRADAVAVAPGLSANDIDVELRYHGSELDAVRVAVRQYRLSGAFGGMELAGKPAVIFPYLGGSE